jgi:hypothetical protein
MGVGMESCLKDYCKSLFYMHLWKTVPAPLNFLRPDIRFHGAKYP